MKKRKRKRERNKESKWRGGKESTRDWDKGNKEGIGKNTIIAKWREWDKEK